MLSLGLALFLLFITGFSRFTDSAMQLQCAMCEQFLTNDCQMMKDMLALTECGGI